MTTLRFRAVGLVFAAALLAGCATGPDANPRDPLEPFNRGVSSFNDAVDRAVLKPVATAYQDATPGFVRSGVNNFFGNLRDVWSAVNATLQLKPRAATENALRVGINTMFGFGGLFDLATEMGIERTSLDFGQTLGRWGVPSGPYLVLPVFGPSSFRDAGGWVVDSRADLVGNLDDVSDRNVLYGLRAVDTRAGLLRASSLLEGAALDPYSFMRDAYLQRRQSLIENLVEEGSGLGNVEPAPR